MKHVLKPLVVTTFTNTWFMRNHAFIEEVLGRQPNSEVRPIQSRFFFPVTPPTVTKDGKITREWYKKNITPHAGTEFNMIFFVFTKAQRKEWGLSAQWAGKYFPDHDDIYESYVIVNEGDDDEYKRIMCHEAFHGTIRMAGQLESMNEQYQIPFYSNRAHRIIDDPIHYHDYHLKDVFSLAPLISFSRWSRLMQIVPLLKKVVELLTEKKKVTETLLEETPPSMPTPQPPVQKPSRLVELAKAIEVFEDYVRPGEKYRDGSIAQYGSLSYKNCNPGNLRWSPMQDGQRGGFSYFSTYEEGFNALLHQLKISVDGRSKVYKPTMTLLEFFNVYAPSSDGNFPRSYATFVAKRLGVSVDTVISTLA